MGQICSKRVFLVENGKIAIARASMVITYYVKFFRTGADRHSSILMPLLLLVPDTVIEENAHILPVKTKNLEEIGVLWIFPLNQFESLEKGIGCRNYDYFHI